MPRHDLLDKAKADATKELMSHATPQEIAQMEAIDAIEGEEEQIASLALFSALIDRQNLMEPE